MRADLDALFSLFAHNAYKSAPCGSTLANESYNNTVSSKALKKPGNTVALKASTFESKQ